MEERPADLRDRLEADHAGWLAGLEQTAFMRALRGGALPRRSRNNQRRALGLIHSAVERSGRGLLELSAGSLPEIGRRPLPIQRPEGATDPEPASAIPAVMEACLDVTRLVRSRVPGDPVALVAYLHVLEAHLSGERPPWEEAGTEAAATVDWGPVFERLETTPGHAERLVALAREFRTALLTVFEALVPVGQAPEVLPLEVLNAEAGTHHIPEDWEDIDAAIRAAERCRAHFPYFQARYGERGRRFSTSDSAWLVTLTELDASAAIRQVRWLGALLAARGMPRVTLECHLRFLHEELATGHPRAGHPGVLLDAAAALRDDRRRYLSDEEVERRCGEFAQLTRDCAPFANGGPVVVSAAADELAQVPNALTSALAWLTDRTRFTPRWVDAVERTVQAVLLGQRGSGR